MSLMNEKNYPKGTEISGEYISPHWLSSPSSTRLAIQDSSNTSQNTSLTRINSTSKKSCEKNYLPPAFVLVETVPVQDAGAVTKSMGSNDMLGMWTILPDPGMTCLF